MPLLDTSCHVMLTFFILKSYANKMHLRNNWGRNTSDVYDQKTGMSMLASISDGYHHKCGHYHYRSHFHRIHHIVQRFTVI